MEVCGHPESRKLHGFTSAAGTGNVKLPSPADHVCKNRGHVNRQRGSGESGEEPQAAMAGLDDGGRVQDGSGDWQDDSQQAPARLHMNNLDGAPVGPCAICGRLAHRSPGSWPESTHMGPANWGVLGMYSQVGGDAHWTGPPEKETSRSL
ncbi:hypothetical protein PCANC_20973 [Puccinia coronata f. sp. avenae]|uniref:Uncharacterized protein n=1 Tax=Puccinia coronata f. sp. avenae TaxID=200324 RepID=A0A2N5UBL1_9BASI|nr:hypothetical protein PCANC_28202 [Puccinia coronata f. sp. avenae]PLW07097.1 hypothetical protein PCASD_25405 [Puccinia coronata f. sp. avenae]PLW35134.1 hypothetical protein PCANC_20973 [Puccinia coronata f. sp. avenae]PLW35839.1 hypothetical protein PCASD_14454 [Puccinia coronata f. sp. avenae]